MWWAPIHRKRRLLQSVSLRLRDSLFFDPFIDVIFYSIWRSCLDTLIIRLTNFGHGNRWEACQTPCGAHDFLNRPCLAYHKNRVWYYVPQLLGHGSRTAPRGGEERIPTGPIAFPNWAYKLLQSYSFPHSLICLGIYNVHSRFSVQDVVFFYETQFLHQWNALCVTVLIGIETILTLALGVSL